MKLKYYLRGMGIGIMITTLILIIAFSIHKNDTVQQEEPKQEAASKTVAEAQNSTQIPMDTETETEPATEQNNAEQTDTQKTTEKQKENETSVVSASTEEKESEKKESEEKASEQKTSETKSSEEKISERLIFGYHRSDQIYVKSSDRDDTHYPGQSFFYLLSYLVSAVTVFGYCFPYFLRYTVL